VSEEWKDEPEKPFFGSLFGGMFAPPTEEDKARWAREKAENDGKAALAALTLRAYGHVPCLKCGGETSKVRHCQGGCHRRTDAGDGEHMHWTCKTCRYEWFTHTLDQGVDA